MMVEQGTVIPGFPMSLERDGYNWNLRKLKSNSSQILQTLQDQGCAVCPTETMIESQSILGIQWSPTHDTLAIQIPPPFSQASQPTKRNMLSYLASLFDPLGLLAPVTLLAKKFVQQLWLEHDRQTDQ